MHADLVFRNGTIITVDQRRPRAEAVAVVGNRIAAVGSTTDISAWIGPRTQVVDLKGRTLLPGFNDAHNHMLMYGQVLAQIDAAPMTAMGDLMATVAARARETRPGEWIRGWGLTPKQGVTVEEAIRMHTRRFLS